MPYTTPTVNYSATVAGTYTTLTGVQSVSVSRGRQRFNDNFPQTNCVIELIPANSYALPLAVGQFIDIRDTNSASSPCYFAGVITDVDRKFSIPYNSITGAAPADRITITATGPLGALGKSSYFEFVLNNTPVTNAIFGAAGLANVYAGNNVSSPTECSAQVYTGGALDLINQLLRTNQFLIDDLDGKRQGGSYTYPLNQFPAGQGNLNYTFSDAGTGGAFKFSGLEYLSSVQNVFTQVQVNPVGLDAQVAASGSAPYNTLVYDTFNESEADALSLANYILATQSLVATTPFSITTNTQTADTCTTLSRLSTTDVFDGISSQAMILGSAVTILFRGTTALAQIIGINTVFYPDYAQVQLYLSPSLGTPFTLDSSAFGVLDTNRLGYP